MRLLRYRFPNTGYKKIITAVLVLALKLFPYMAPEAAGMMASVNIPRVSGSLQQQALDVAQLMICQLDGTILHWTRGMERLYGWPHSDAIGRNSHELLRTEFPQPLNDIEAQLIDEGQWLGELVNRRRNGEVVVANSQRSLTHDTSDAAPVVIAIDTDVTQEKRHAEALRYLSNIIDSSDDAIIGKTLNGIITSWNNAAQQMFGYTADEIVGQSITILFPPDRLTEEEQIIERIKRGERVDHFETIRCRKGGIEFPVSLTVSPIIGASGHIIGVSKIARDISERARAQASLQEIQSELFHVSRLNTISHMASGLAHELNQPLAAISNYLSGIQRLLDDRADDSAKTLQEALARASEQTQRAGQIVRRLRDFMSRGETDCSIESIAKMIKEAVELAFMGVKDRGVRVYVNFAPNVDRVIIDRIQIHQVLVNLLRNAIQAMEGFDRRELAIATAAAADGMVEISIADTGPGIAEDVAAHLFQPFVTTKRGGMGVGLSISKTIIDAHGGRIWIERNPSGGTIFRFTLPLAVDGDP